MGAGKKLVKETGFQVRDNCEYLEDTFSLQNGPHLLCDANVPFHRVAMNNPTPSEAEGVFATMTTSQGSDEHDFSQIRLTHKGGWMSILRGDGVVYDLGFEGFIGYANLSYTGTVFELAPGESIIMQHQVNSRPDKVFFSNKKVESIDIYPDSSVHNNFDWFYNSTTKAFSFLIKNDEISEASRKRRSAGGLGVTLDDVVKNIDFEPKLVRCWYENCAKPDDPATMAPTMGRPERFDYLSEIVWEEAQDNTWGLSFKVPNGPNTGAKRKRRDTTMPSTGDNLLITPEMWLVWDEGQDLGQVWDTIVVKGVLEIENPNAKLQARNIIVSGGRIIVGWNETDHYDGDLFEIVLHGSAEDEETYRLVFEI